MCIEPGSLCQYLSIYIKKYKELYSLYTTSLPQGLGYPEWDISQYLSNNRFDCYIGHNGVAIAVFSNTQFPVTIGGHPNALDEIKFGFIDEPLESFQSSSYQCCEIHAAKYDYSWESLISRLTFGASIEYFERLNNLPTKDQDFWNPLIIRSVNFCSPDKLNTKSFLYLELSPHVEPSAWDARSIPARLELDIKRDFFLFLNHKEINEKGGMYIPGKTTSTLLFDRLSGLHKSIHEFVSLLKDRSKEDEKVFHQFLYQNPHLLDLYAEKVIDRPRFSYPPGKPSPLRKSYVEPDFIIRYPNNTYKVVELEKPDKSVATKDGQPSYLMTQASFQLTEFEHFIRNHPAALEDQFPGLPNNYKKMLIIGRSSQESFGDKKKEEYMGLLYSHYAGIHEILTYDDLIEKALQALVQLANLGSLRESANEGLDADCQHT